MRPVAALVRGSRRELRARVAESTAGSRLTALPDLLARVWPSEDLARIMGRTMALELDVARAEGRLCGNTPREWYADYVRLLGDPATQRALWARYPVLLRHIGDLLAGWVDSRAEFAERLVADLAELDTWCDGGLGEVTEVRFGAGDTHRRGRSAAVVSFAGATVVYRPRSLDAALAWGKVLDWYHRQAPPHDLIAQAPLARDGYGWSRFVEALSYRTPEAFSWRTGALLALHHALCGVDVQRENLIGHGAYPVVIDTEALFRGALPAPATRHRTTPADDLMADGVLSVGLLPPKPVVHDKGNVRAPETGRSGRSGGGRPSPPCRRTSTPASTRPTWRRASRGRTGRSRRTGRAGPLCWTGSPTSSCVISRAPPRTTPACWRTVGTPTSSATRSTATGSSPGWRSARTAAAPGSGWCPRSCATCAGETCRASRGRPARGISWTATACGSPTAWRRPPSRRPADGSPGSARRTWPPGRC